MRAFQTKAIQNALFDSDKFRRDTIAEATKEVTTLKQKLNEVTMKEVSNSNSFAQTRRDYELRTKQLESEQKTLNDALTDKNNKIRTLQQQLELMKKTDEDFSTATNLVTQLKERIAELENRQPTTDLEALKNETMRLRNTLKEQLALNEQHLANIAHLNEQIIDLSQDTHMRNELSRETDNAQVTIQAVANLIDEKIQPLLTALQTHMQPTFARTVARTTVLPTTSQNAMNRAPILQANTQNQLNKPNQTRAAVEQPHAKISYASPRNNF